MDKKIDSKDYNIRKAYENKNKFKLLTLIISILCILLLGIYFMTVGVAQTNITNIINAIGLAITGNLEQGSDSAQNKIIILMRLPRVIMAIVSGIGLSISGVAMQSITKNPLVSPFTVGVSSAAALGASISIVFGIGFFPGTDFGIVMNAFLTSILCAFLVYIISKRVGMNPTSIVLTGIALNYLFNALTSSIQFFAQEHKLAAAVQWSFGTFNAITWNEVIVVILFTTICSLIIYKFSNYLNVMSSGEDELVKSLGINPDYVRIIIGASSVLMTASIISFCGVIGFVGLIGPHIARILVGNNHKFLIPYSGVIGALLLMVSDTLGRIIISPVIIPVGIVVSFLGVPIFINLIIKNRRESC